MARQNLDEKGLPIPASKEEVKAILKNCKVGKKGDFEPNVWRIETLPTALLVDKFARSNAITVCKSGLDADAKKVWYEQYVNVHETKMVDFTFEQVAAEFGWKEIKLSEDQQTVYPTWMAE